MLDLKKKESLMLALDILRSDYVRDRYGKSGTQSEDGTITATYASAVDAVYNEVLKTALSDRINGMQEEQS